MVSIEKCRRFVVVAEVEGTGGGDGLVEGFLDDPGVFQGDHGAELAADDEVACGEAQAGGEDAVVGARGAAALEVAEDDGAGLDPGQVFDLAGDDVADPAEPAVAEGVERSRRG